MLELITIKVENDLDQAVNIQVYANHESSTTKSKALGSAFAVGAGQVEVRTLAPGLAVGWLPWLYLAASSSTAPASGSLTARLIKLSGAMEFFFKDYEIRDTATHNSRILRW